VAPENRIRTASQGGRTAIMGPYVALMFDPHLVGEINEVLGTAIGDSYFRRIAEVLRAGLRNTDYLLRAEPGSGQFIVLAPLGDRGQEARFRLTVQERVNLLSDRLVSALVKDSVLNGILADVRAKRSTNSATVSNLLQQPLISIGATRVTGGDTGLKVYERLSINTSKHKDSLRKLLRSCTTVSCSTVVNPFYTGE
jgi:GGDEF domain-containing protein